MLMGVIGLDYRGKSRFLLHNESEEKYVWNTGDLLWRSLGAPLYCISILLY